MEDFVEHFARSPQSYDHLRKSQPMFNFPLLRQWRQQSRRFSQDQWVADFAGQLLQRPGMQIRTAAGINIPLSNQQIKEFTCHFKREWCRALSLFTAYFKGWSLTSGGEGSSDFEDCFHLVGLAYCDKAFLDKRVCDAVSKAVDSPLPKRNGEFGRWVKNPSP